MVTLKYSYTSTIDNLIATLNGLASSSGHPEIAHAGIVVHGLSQGGLEAIKLARLNKDRIIAVLPLRPVGPIQEGNDGFNINRRRLD